MTPERFEVIVRGATEIWDVECRIEFMDSRPGCLLWMIEHKVSICHEVTSFGNVWRIIGLDGRERVHPSLRLRFHAEQGSGGMRQEGQR